MMAILDIFKNFSKRYEQITLFNLIAPIQIKTGKIQAKLKPAIASDSYIQKSKATCSIKPLIKSQKIDFGLHKLKSTESFSGP